MAATPAEIIDMLKTSYNMELETVLNYLNYSINLDGVRAEEIKKSLAGDVTAEIMHAQQLGARIKQLGGQVEGAIGLKFGSQIPPSTTTTDVVHAIKAVINAEEAACAQYKKIIQACEGEDYITQDLCVRLMADEAEHLSQFRGFLKEYTQG
ncbi:MAG: ferritin-like domain-containing protein [Pirellulales bacterium]|nr:ferritin-like domain-containing protein [Pirellulales bacterium]